MMIMKPISHIISQVMGDSTIRAIPAIYGGSALYMVVMQRVGWFPRKSIIGLTRTVLLCIPYWGSEMGNWKSEKFRFIKVKAIVKNTCYLKYDYNEAFYIQKSFSFISIKMKDIHKRAFSSIANQIPINQIGFLLTSSGLFGQTNVTD